MKMIYKEPEIEIIFFKSEDCIKASSIVEDTTTTTPAAQIAPEDAMADAADIMSSWWTT